MAKKESGNTKARFSAQLVRTLSHRPGQVPWPRSALEWKGTGKRVDTERQRNGGHVTPLLGWRPLPANSNPGGCRFSQFPPEINPFFSQSQHISSAHVEASWTSWNILGGQGDTRRVSGKACPAGEWARGSKNAKRTSHLELRLLQRMSHFEWKGEEEGEPQTSRSEVSYFSLLTN